MSEIIEVKKELLSLPKALETTGEIELEFDGAVTIHGLYIEASSTAGTITVKRLVGGTKKKLVGGLSLGSSDQNGSLLGPLSFPAGTKLYIESSGLASQAEMELDYIAFGG